MRKAILVLGPPRSGTSAVAHIINRLGVTFGDHSRFVDSSVYKFNPVFFELESLNRLNDEIFSRFSKTFGDFDWMPKEADFDNIDVSTFEEKIFNFVANEFHGSGLIGLKDPRFCFTLPIWDRALKRLSFDVEYVVTRRQSASVLSSNKKITSASEANLFRLVAQSVLLTHEFTKGKNFVEVDYDKLIHNALTEVTKLCRALNLKETFVTDACSVVRRELNHENNVGLPEFDFPYLKEVVDRPINDNQPLFYRNVFWAARSDLDIELGNLIKALEISEAHKEKLNAKVNELVDTVKEQAKTTGGLEKSILELKSSASWRLTLPFRSIVDLFNFFNPMRYFDSLAPHPETQERNQHNINGDEAHWLEYGRGALDLDASESLHLQSDGLKRLGSKFMSTSKSFVRAKGGFLPALSSLAAILRAEGWVGLQSRMSELVLPNNRTHYANWIQRYDTLTEESKTKIRIDISALKIKPLISIVMPTYNSNIEWLKLSIESVLNQIYPNWELCIADDASTDPGVRDYLSHISAQDRRIKVVFRNENGHISAASNSALKIVSGTWVALLDHDDMLAEHALYFIARSINEYPQVKMIYSDEDKIDEAGNRKDPYFKTDWNIDLFYSQNMFSHLGVYHRELLDLIGGFRQGLEGAQDYDLALRCIEHIDKSQIHHIPRVLYHWRVHDESTAKNSDAKPYAMLAGEKALNEHFDRIGVDAKAELIGFGYRIHYLLPADLPLVTVIIPTRNKVELLRCCIESILSKTEYEKYEILVIDNNSDDSRALSYLDDISGHKKITVIRDDRPFNYSALNNAAVDLSHGELIVLLNNDIEVISSNWLSEMVSHALQPGVGAVGAKLWFPNNTVQHAGIVCGLGSHRVAGHAHYQVRRGNHGYFGRLSLTSSFSAVSGACMMVKKKVYREVQGLNEKDLAVSYNDVDFCLKLIERGYRNVFTPFAELYHHESASRGDCEISGESERFASEVNYMKRRWGEMLLCDPCYSPNLTLDYSDFSYAWPPRNPAMGR